MREKLPTEEEQPKMKLDKLDAVEVDREDESVTSRTARLKKRISNKINKVEKANPVRKEFLSSDFPEMDGLYPFLFSNSNFTPFSHRPPSSIALFP